MDSGNINSKDIDEDIDGKLRGDAIGNTLYSATFVTKTLLQLSNIEWTTQLEEDLCFVWDMTLEKDICDYLLELSYPAIVSELLKQEQENRLIEILIGILANIFSVVKEYKITEEVVNVVLEQLNSDDSLILIQVVRFLKAMAYLFEEMDFVNGDVIGQISFIFQSSTNIDLLINTLDAVAKLTNNCKINIDLLRGDIIPDIFTALCEIKGKSDLGNSDVRTAYVHVHQIICNLCAYTQDTRSILLNELKNYSNLCVDEFSQILNYFSEEENLLPVPAELDFYIEALSYTFETLTIKNYPGIFESVCKITSILIKEEYENVEPYIELVHLMTSLGSLRSLQESVSSIPLKTLQPIFRTGKVINDDIRNKIRLMERSCKEH